MTNPVGESAAVPLPRLFSRIADLAASAEASLLRWGITAQPPTRLEQAVAALRAAAAAAIDATGQGLVPILRAAWVAADFIDIAEYLPRDRVRSLRQELTLALNGELWPATENHQPLQFQTQHWVGAVLMHAGLEIEHAVYSARRAVKIPEFFVINGTQRTGVEVKRPMSARRVSTVVSEAMEKFRAHDCLGAIVMELTDCVDTSTSEKLVSESEAIMHAAHTTIWDVSRGSYRPGFEKLIYLGGIVRGGWEVPRDDPTRLRMMGHAFHQGYAGRRGTLAALRSDWLRERFNDALDGVVRRLDVLGSRPGV